MAKGNARDPKREGYWRGHLKGQRASGLTIRDYCADEGLRETSFHFWKGEIARRDRQRDEAKPSAAAPAFVPVTIVDPSAAPVVSSAIDIKLMGGHRLRVRSGCDRRLLAEVVAVLEGRPC